VEGVRVRGGVAHGVGEGGWGGGLYVAQSGRVGRVIVSGSAAELGGGVYVHDGAALYSCLLVSNVAQRGGGVAVGAGGALYNCTVAENTAALAGGGVQVSNGVVWNAIVWSNTAPGAANYALQAGAGMHYSCSVPLATGISNIVADPLFDNSYRIAPESPCVDAGYTFAWAWGARDVEGELRVRGSGIDMGAYEAVPEGGGTTLWVALAWGCRRAARRTH